MSGNDDSFVVHAQIHFKSIPLKNLPPWWLRNFVLVSETIPLYFFMLSCITIWSYVKTDMMKKEGVNDAISLHALFLRRSLVATLSWEHQMRPVSPDGCPCVG